MSNVENKEKEKPLVAIIITTFICWLYGIFWLLELPKSLGFIGFDIFVCSIIIFFFLIPITIIYKLEKGWKIDMYLNHGKFDYITLFFPWFGIFCLIINILYEAMS